MEPAHALRARDLAVGVEAGHGRFTGVARDAGHFVPDPDEAIRRGDVVGGHYGFDRLQAALATRKDEAFPSADVRKRGYYERFLRGEKLDANWALQMSLGEQQRVAIARALAIEPEILLMDEPFAALDEQTRLLLGDKVLQIQQELQQTTLLITHNITEAILLADRVVAMSRRPGRIARIVDVALPRPRAVDMEFSPQFKSYSDEIRAVIYHGEGDGGR